jgi:hypothetical protein
MDTTRSQVGERLRTDFEYRLKQRVEETLDATRNEREEILALEVEEKLREEFEGGLIDAIELALVDMRL